VSKSTSTKKISAENPEPSETSSGRRRTFDQPSTVASSQSRSRACTSAAESAMLQTLCRQRALQFGGERPHILGRSPVEQDFIRTRI
jgi:hypothetical protein